MRLEALDRPTAANIVKHARGVLVAGHQKAARRIDAHARHGRSLPRVGAGSGRHHIYTTPRSQIPEANGLVLRSGDEHRAAPVVQREDVAAVTAERLVGRRCRAIGDVDLAIARPATNQQTRFVGAVLEEAQVADCAVVHRQFNLLRQIDD